MNGSTGTEGAGTARDAEPGHPAEPRHPAEPGDHEPSGRSTAPAVTRGASGGPGLLPPPKAGGPGPAARPADVAGRDGGFAATAGAGTATRGANGVENAAGQPEGSRPPAGADSRVEGAENGLGPDPDRPAGDPRADGDGGFAAPADAGTAVAGRRRGSGAAGDLAEEDSGFPRTDAADAGTAARGASVGEAAGGARRPGDSGAGDLAGQDGGFAPGAVADSRVGGPDRSAGEPSAAGAGVDPAEGDGELGAEPGRADADSDDAAEGGTRKGAVSRAGVLIGLLLALLGFALAVQVRSNTSTSGLPSARQEDLVRILDELSSREERLRRQISSLEAAKARLSTTGDRSQVALAEARIRSTALGILAGTIPAQGPGIQLTLVDPDGKITAEDLLDAVEELRAAGAEAIQVGGVRIGLSSSFTTSDAGLAVDGQRVDAPYTILAIGDPPTLATAMQIPGGVADSARRAGGEARVVQQQQLVIRALRTLRPPQYSRPADGGR